MRVLPVIAATIAAFFVAFMGATVTDLGPWYQALIKPVWTAPDGLFPIAWTIIFALITVSFITAWRAAPTSRDAQGVVSLFALNAFLNICWSLLFFRLQRPDWAFIELGILWFSVLVMIVSCVRFSRPAAAMLLPYLGWLTYAGALNWAIVYLNGPFG
ncbi:MAG: tryptophan-rich sensory protein [Erythrobacter sp.]|nr:tryptophan-rich sensory protein [Erythrobacter sp.]